MPVRDGSPSDHPYDLRVVSRERDQLGEGPVWDDRTRTLLRVDIVRGRVLALKAARKPSAAMPVNGEVSAIVPREAGGFLLAIGHEIVAVGSQGDRRTLAIVEDKKAENRFNDCRCDPQGRLWAGTMNKMRAPRLAGLYCLAVGQPIRCVVADATLSNGIGWSPDDALMYFIDSTTQRIDVFDFDGAAGALSDRRCFAEIDPSDGLPDGLAVDADGGVWVCLFGGGEVRRYAPDGGLDEIVKLPVTNPTCPAFGGADLRTLYITTARHRLSPEQLAREELAGAVLALEPGVAGLPVNRFAG